MMEKFGLVVTSSADVEAKDPSLQDLPFWRDASEYSGLMLYV